MINTIIEKIKNDYEKQFQEKIKNILLKKEKSEYPISYLEGVKNSIEDFYLLFIKSKNIKNFLNKINLINKNNESWVKCEYNSVTPIKHNPLIKYIKGKIYTGKLFIEIIKNNNRILIYILILNNKYINQNL